MTALCRCVRVERLATAVQPFAIAQLHRDRPYQALLESRGESSSRARYSFFCTDPFLVFRSERRRAYAGPPGDLARLAGEPLAELAALLARYGGDRRTGDDELPPFLGGAIGYLGYELLELRDGIPDRARPGLELPDAYLLFCDTVFSSDAHEKRTWVSTTGFGTDAAEAASAAERNMVAALARVAPLLDASLHADMDVRSRPTVSTRARLTEERVLEAGLRPTLDHEAYLAVVRAAKENIAAGDVYEVCVCNRFDTTATASGADLYRVLSTISEAPFASYLRFPEVEIASSSPERFLKLDRHRWAETRPIKGTRPRGSTPVEDERLRLELASSEKDRAENVMIVDLARNDLGRVCELGSITVPELTVVETHPFTHQLVSTVRGRLRDELTGIDLVQAAFPGGSMTGAPKIEAMKIIDRLEPVQRGIYSGAIGYFDFDGPLDLDIVIRTLIKKDDLVTFHVGGAIVAGSDPEDEYRETLDKAHGMVAALEILRGT